MRTEDVTLVNQGQLYRCRLRTSQGCLSSPVCLPRPQGRTGRHVVGSSIVAGPLAALETSEEGWGGSRLCQVPWELSDTWNLNKYVDPVLEGRPDAGSKPAASTNFQGGSSSTWILGRALGLRAGRYVGSNPTCRLHFEEGSR